MRFCCSLRHFHPVLSIPVISAFIVCYLSKSLAQDVNNNGNNANIRSLDPPAESNDINNIVANTSSLQSSRHGNLIHDVNNPQCEYNWHRFEDKCFYFLGTSSSHTFEEARYECSKYFKANVATIKSEAEQKFVESILKGVVIYNNVWLGSKWLPETIDSKSGYYWVDGSPLVYHNKLLSPDLIRGNKSNLCLAMSVHTQFYGIWTPYNCNYYFHVLCERNLKLEASSAVSSISVFNQISCLLSIVLSQLILFMLSKNQVLPWVFFAF